jgi:ssRNA-specific RNase YbeY (16S rRNA maturation enzyme)
MRSIPPRMELLLYALHGMLHLSGFDDRTDRDFALMHRTEDSILESLGFAPVFHPRPSDIR